MSSIGAGKHADLPRGRHRKEETPDVVQSVTAAISDEDERTSQVIPLGIPRQVVRSSQASQNSQASDLSGRVAVTAAGDSRAHGGVWGAFGFHWSRHVPAPPFAFEIR